jgi:hypothetical protein
MLPNLAWKTQPVFPDPLDDTFGFFDQNAFLKQVRGIHQDSEEIKLPRQDDEEIIRQLIYRISSRLPRITRHIITSMLEPLPEKRTNWTMIWRDDWIRTITCPFDST